MNRGFLITLFLWLLLSLLGIVLSHGSVPLNRPAMNGMSPIMQVGLSSAAIVVLLIEIGVVCLVARGRPYPNLAARAPEPSVAIREIWALWIYFAIVMLLGRYSGFTSSVRASPCT